MDVVVNVMVVEEVNKLVDVPEMVIVVGKIVILSVTVLVVRDVNRKSSVEVTVRVD